MPKTTYIQNGGNNYVPEEKYRCIGIASEVKNIIIFKLIKYFKFIKDINISEL